MKNRYKNDDIWCFDEKYYNYFRICFVLKISRSMIRQFQYFIRACSHPRGLNFIWRKVFRRQRCLTPINIMIANSTNFPARFGSDRGPLKRRILQKQISYGIGSNRIWEGEEKGRFIGGGGKRLKNFSNFFIRQLFPFMRVICTDPLFFFPPFFPSPPSSSSSSSSPSPFVIKNSDCSDDKENKFRFSVEKSRPEMEWLDTGSRSTAGKYRFYDWTIPRMCKRELVL